MHYALRVKRVNAGTTEENRISVSVLLFHWVVIVLVLLLLLFLFILNSILVLFLFIFSGGVAAVPVPVHNPDPSDSWWCGLWMCVVLPLSLYSFFISLCWELGVWSLELRYFIFRSQNHIHIHFHVYCVLCSYFTNPSRITMQIHVQNIFSCMSM